MDNITENEIASINEWTETESYVVTYAKIVESKDGDIVLDGVFFGGVGYTKDEADDLARQCVNSIRGGTIIPKIVNVIGCHQVLEALYDATEAFEKITAQMLEANEAILRTQNRKKK